MTINILEHLENIKIYSDYIHSELDSIEMFWEQIDKGKSIKKDIVKTIKYEVDTNNYDPTEIDLERFEEERRRKESIDFSEEYINAVRGTIETKLEYDNAEMPETIEIQNIYETIIEANGNLESYLNTSKDIFNRYVEVIGNDLPQSFFKKLKEKEILSNSKKHKLDYNTENDFSVFEWATIFYYVFEKKLLKPSNTIKEAWEQFMSDHKIGTTTNTFKTNYYSAKRRLHSTQDYPIKKLEKIMPFIEKNYKQALTSLINDKEFLEYEQAE
ncbi:hypothetical protein U0L90_02580 [Flavobacteriaceae sp. LMIT009]